MIRSFVDRDAARLFVGGRPRRLPADLRRVAQRKLAILDAADSLEDLRVPPGNRLEKLLGDRQGAYSIRINDQWRVCFLWIDGHAEKVEFVDYHRG